MTKDALDFVGSRLDSPCPLFATVVGAATLVAEKLWVEIAEGVSVMTPEFDAGMLEFICKEAPDRDNEGVTAVSVVVLTPDRRNWKKSMATSRPCGGNICKRVAISITVSNYFLDVLLNFAPESDRSD